MSIAPDGRRRFGTVRDAVVLVLVLSPCDLRVREIHRCVEELPEERVSVGSVKAILAAPPKVTTRSLCVSAAVGTDTHRGSSLGGCKTGVMAEGVEGLEWVDEIPLPLTNLAIQKTAYVLEQWLRRVALAALMAKAGSRWLDAIPEDLVPEAKKSLALLRRRTYLEPENSDNLIWALTLEQLRTLLIDREIAGFVFNLTGLSRSEVSTQVERLRDIRNIVAHNRATNAVAWENLRLVEHKLSGGIKRFKTTLIYWDMAEDKIQDATAALQSAFRTSGLSGGRDFVVWQRDRFNEFRIGVDDPLRSRAPFFSLSNLLDAAEHLRTCLLAIVLPLDSLSHFEREFALLRPADVTDAELTSIRDFALSLVPDSSKPYTEQDPKYVCDPLIWFESGWVGVTVAGE